MLEVEKFSRSGKSEDRVEVTVDESMISHSIMRQYVTDNR